MKRMCCPVCKTQLIIDHHSVPKHYRLTGDDGIRTRVGNLKVCEGTGIQVRLDEVER